MSLSRNEVRRLFRFVHEMLQKRAYLLVLFLSLTHFGRLCQTSCIRSEVPVLRVGSHRWIYPNPVHPLLCPQIQTDEEVLCVDREEGEEPKDVCQKAHNLAVFYDAGKLFVSRLFLSIVFGSYIQRYSTIYGRKPFLLLALSNALIPPVLLLLNLQADLPFYW